MRESYGQAEAFTLPSFAYLHADRVVPGSGASYPPEYAGALFFLFRLLKVLHRNR